MKVAQKKEIEMGIISFLRILGNLAVCVFICWNVMLFSQLYAASELPKGIFKTFWVIGSLITIIKCWTIDHVFFIERWYTNNKHKIRGFK